MNDLSKHESKLFVQHAVTASQARGMNQKQLAELLGIEPSRLSEAKKGKGSITDSRKKIIIEHFGLPARGKGQYVRGEIYSSVDDFIAQYEATSTARHLSRLRSIFERKDYQQLVCSLFLCIKHPTDEENYAAICQFINELIDDDTFTSWGKALHDYLDADDNDANKPEFPNTLIERMESGFSETCNARFVIAHAQKTRSYEFQTILYWLWFYKDQHREFVFASTKHPIESPHVNNKMVITGDVVLEYKQNLRDNQTINKFDSNDRRFRCLGNKGLLPTHLPYPSAGIDIQGVIDPTPDYWPDVDVRLFLSNSMDYRLWIRLHKADSRCGPGQPEDYRDVVIKQIPWTTLHKDIEKVRKWIGVAWSFEDQINHEIACAGGYVPGAEVL